MKARLPASSLLLPTALLSTPLLSTPLLLTALVAGSACSAEQVASKGSHGIETPLAPPRAQTAADGEAPSVLDFRKLSAYLADERFEVARLAYHDGRHAEACDAFEAALGEELLQQRIDAEAWFQVGHLRHRAGRFEAAALAFANASKARWPLAGYARYLAAVSHVAAGQGAAALPLLAEVPPGLPISEPSDMLRCELLLKRGEPGEAREALRALLRRDPRPEGWPQASLLLARSLLAHGSTNPVERAAEVEEALHLARRVSIELAGARLALESTEVERQALALMTPQAFQVHEPLTLDEELVRLSSLVERREWDDARVAADELLDKSSKAAAFSELDCEARLLRAKAQGGLKQWGKAVDQLGDALERCRGEDLRARMLFVAGKFAQIDRRYGAATTLFAKLEAEAPTHRLADDARIRRAQSYLELGDQARFTELLGSITIDYPDGDVALDGLFELALRRIEKGAWSQAINVLDRAFPRAVTEDRVRDHEVAGRERYFRARALAAVGEKENALLEYEALIRERPLSYYMLLAFSRLEREDSARAKRALDAAMTATEQAPFTFPHRPEFDGDVFQRALALARHGELDWASRELGSIDALDQPELLWAVALVYGRTGAADRAHSLARGKLTDWLGRWPVGDWRAPWELAFPRPFHPIVERVAAKEGVPEALIYAVMREESAFRPEVVSPAEAYGLMQLIKPTAQHFGKKLGLPHDEAALRRPSINIALGASVLSNYEKSFPGNPLLVVPGYNAGPGRPKRWLAERNGYDFDVWVELIPFTETRRYTKRVLSSRGAYTFLYGEAEPEALLLPLRFERD